MIKSIKVTNYLNDSITLELMRPDLSGFIVKTIDGLGPAKASINTSEIATADGGVYNSARLDTRNIVFDLEFMQTKTESIEDIRLKSYKYFPIKKPVRLTIETDNRLLETEGYVESNEPNIFSKNEGTRISIICPDPYLYSKNISTNDFNSIEPMFEFPFGTEENHDPYTLGEINILTTANVIYEGDATIGIDIIIHALGSVSSITIVNTLTNEHMVINTTKLASMTSSGIKAGDTIIITTQIGNKSVTLIRDGVETNILNCLDRGFTWFTLNKGDNIFAYTAEEGSINVQFCVKNKIAYEGV